MTKRQKSAKKKLDAHMAALKAALARRDLKAARAARSAARDEVKRLADHLTRVERSELWKCKLLMHGLEKARRDQRRATKSTVRPARLDGWQGAR